MTEMKFHVTQEKHVLQSDECVFEMNTKKENVSRLTINHHILFTKTDNHVENHVEGQFPIKNTRSLKKRCEFLFQLEQLVLQKSASGVGRNCAENFFRGGGRTQGLEEDLQKFLSLSFEQQWGKFWKTFLFLICRKVSKWYFAKVIPRLVLSLNSLFLSGAEWEKTICGELPDPSILSLAKTDLRTNWFLADMSIYQ